MKKPQLICLQPLLFTLAGTIIGLVYYRYIGCISGSCSIASNPIASMVYMGMIGLLLAVVFRKEGAGSCSM